MPTKKAVKKAVKKATKKAPAKKRAAKKTVAPDQPSVLEVIHKEVEVPDGYVYTNGVITNTTVGLDFKVTTRPYESASMFISQTAAIKKGGDPFALADEMYEGMMRNYISPKLAKFRAKFQGETSE